MTQKILCQVQAIKVMQKFRKKLASSIALDIDEGTEIFKQFLSAYWLDPNNTAAIAYLGLSNSRLNIVSIVVIGDPEIRKQTQITLVQD